MGQHTTADGHFKVLLEPSHAPVSTVTAAQLNGLEYDQMMYTSKIFTMWLLKSFLILQSSQLVCQENI